MRPIYLDNHSTTPCDPRVVDAMLPFFTDKFGNAASRTHTYGFEARSAVEHARTQMANLIGAGPKEIVWTSGATESDNLAVLGVARQLAGKGRHLVTSVVEHKAVLDAAGHLAARGWEVTWIPVDDGGRVNPADVREALRPDTVLVSIMLANNEVGTVQPVAEIGALCREAGVLLHTDAAQALGRMPVDVTELGVDLLSISAHKMYGPKGIGALYVRRGRPRVRLEALQFGGGHERGLRSGTLPVPLIVGAGAAAQIAADEISTAVPHLRQLRDRLLGGLQDAIDGVRVNGSLEHRLPNNLNASFDGVEAEALMMGCRQLAVSSGSACTSETLEPSYVLRAMGIDGKRAHSSLRFGVGRFNTVEEIDRAVVMLADKVKQLRELDPMMHLSGRGRDADTLS